jgi:hypothetical protein
MFHVMSGALSALREGLPMLPPESPGPNDVPSSGRVVWLDGDAVENLFPRTTIDHLLSEKERRKAEQERKEFEALGRRMDLIQTEQVLYCLFYDSASGGVAAGASPEDIQAEMMLLSDTPDGAFASIVRQAYGDVLAGRPPRFTSRGT